MLSQRRLFLGRSYNLSLDAAKRFDGHAECPEVKTAIGSGYPVSVLGLP